MIFKLPERPFQSGGSSMVHQRSSEAKMRRLAKKLMLTLSFRDPRLAETVNLVTRSDLLSELGQVPFDVVKGEVLVDSRGRGSFQK